MPFASIAIEDCGTSVTECKLRELINKAQTTADDAKNRAINAQRTADGLQQQVNNLKAVITSLKKKVTILEEYQNVRTIVTKDQADKYCPKGSKAAHVPLSYAGSTGNQICAANDKEEKTCQSVLFVYVTGSNGFRRYSPKDKSCQERIIYPWPWGDSYPIPNTYSPEWSNGNSWVVCCKR